jgi:hypothetical protein
VPADTEESKVIALAVSEIDWTFVDNTATARFRFKGQRPNGGWWTLPDGSVRALRQFSSRQGVAIWVEFTVAGENLSSPRLIVREKVE